MLVGDVEVVGNCREAVINVMWLAYQRGVESISRTGRLDEVWERHRKPKKTVDNTLEAMVGNRKLMRPRRGHYSLAPAMIQRLRADYLLRSNSKKHSQRLKYTKYPSEFPWENPGKAKFPWENHREVSRPIAAQGISSSYFP